MGQLLDALKGVAMPEQKRIQMVNLDEAFEACKAKVKALELEKRNLESEVNPLKEKVKRLEQRVQEQAAKKEKNVVHEELDDLEQSLLSYLASMKRRENRTTKLIADAIREIHPESQMTELKAKVYLGRLEKRELVRYYPSGYSYSTTPEHWDLTERGEEYVVLHKLEHVGGAAQKLLEDNEIAVMKFIGNRKGCTAKDICEGTGFHSVLVEHCLGRLLKGKYLEQSHVPMLGAWYALSDAGNAYLIENRLVPGAETQQPNNPKGHPCDHCGSARLRRTGSRPNEMMREMGIKDFLYNCLDCHKESVFTNDEAQA
jgi:hypothetical protein